MGDVTCYMTDSNNRKPQKISTRPRLPQASLHCPPITAGNEVGLVVYPNSTSNWEIQRVPEYIQITYTPEKVDSSIPFILSVGEDGSRMVQMIPKDLTYSTTQEDYQNAMKTIDTLFNDFHTPAGAITLKANCWFQTPQNWDSLWMGITNQFDPPFPDTYTVRVQTDWYSASSTVEIRYQLKIGQIVKISKENPIGMVTFLERDNLKIEFLEYTDELISVNNRQKNEKLDESYVITEKNLTPHNIWYQTNKK
tara:strand:+ start:1161 stop:1916 length:756 start_codon:yes stop_codon:yes gene_type:complete